MQDHRTDLGRASSDRFRTSPSRKFFPKDAFVVHRGCYPDLSQANYWSASGRFEQVTPQRPSEGLVCQVTVFICCLLCLLLAKRSFRLTGDRAERSSSDESSDKDVGDLSF